MILCKAFRIAEQRVLHAIRVYTISEICSFNADDISDKASMNLKSFNGPLSRHLYQTMCKHLKMACREYFDTYYISLSSNETR